MGLPFHSSSVNTKKDHFSVFMNRNVLAIKLKSVMNQGVKLAQTWANFNREFYLISKSCHVVVYQGIWDGLVMWNA
jgi:hypothetical protein